MAQVAPTVMTTEYVLAKGQVAAQLHTLALEPSGVPQLLARALELAEAQTGLTGAQKKALVIEALQIVSVRLAPTPALAASVASLAQAASTGIDMVVAVTKAPPAAANNGISPQAFTAYLQIKDLVRVAREQSDLDVGAIMQLVPSIVRVLGSVKSFATASSADQVDMAEDVLNACKADAPEDEKPAWALAAAGVGPVIYALHAANEGTLSINGIVAAIANNPQQVATVCVTCITAIGSIVASLVGRR